MITGYENKRLKLNTSLRGHDAGTTIRVRVDKSGIPVDPYWRNRVKDSEVDGCCEFVSGKKPASKADKSK